MLILHPEQGSPLLKQKFPETDIVAVETLRISVVRERQPLTARLASPADAARAVRQFIPFDDPREHFIELIVDTRNKTLSVWPLSIGTINGSLVSPREVFCIAVRELAAAIILGHNHPSGDPSPSAEDRALTNRLVSAGKMLGIEVLDHIVVADDNKYFSFKEHDAL